MSEDDRILVVLQLGSTQVRCGLSGDDAPRRRLTHVLNGRNPISGGVLITPEEDFPVIVRGCVGDDLDCATETRGIFVCDPPTNTPESRKRMAAVLFDVFHFPAVRFYSRTPLCALGACLTNAIVVELGDEHTYVMPVIGCVGVRAALQIGPIAGRQISDWLVKKVQDYNPLVAVTQTSLGFNEIGGIKRQCTVSASRDAYDVAHREALAEEVARLEAAKAKASAQKSATGGEGGVTSGGIALGDSADATGYVLCGSVKNEKTDMSVHEITLPPPGILTSAPEALFQPRLLLPSENKSSGGLAEVIVDAVRAMLTSANPSSEVECPYTPELVAELYAHVVISGAGSLFPGLQARLQAELEPLAAAAHDVHTVSIVADDARSCGAWMGASILSSMRDTDANGFVTEENWKAYGPALFDSWSTE